jgi:hypothetical protein
MELNKLIMLAVINPGVISTKQSDRAGSVCKFCIFLPALYSIEIASCPAMTNRGK